MRTDGHGAQPEQGDILTATQAAAVLGVHPQTVIEWARRGLLPTLPRARQGWHRFRRSDVLALLEPQS